MPFRIHSVGVRRSSTQIRVAGRNVIEWPHDTTYRVTHINSESTACTGYSPRRVEVHDGERRPALSDAQFAVLGPVGGPYAVVEIEQLRQMVPLSRGALDVERLPGVRLFDSIEDANEHAHYWVD